MRPTMARETRGRRTNSEVPLTLEPVIRTNLTHKFTETVTLLTSELGGLIVGDGLHPSTKPIE